MMVTTQGTGHNESTGGAAALAVYGLTSPHVA